MNRKFSLTTTMLLVLFCFSLKAQILQKFEDYGTYTYTVPEGIYCIKVHMWGAGGAGGDATNGAQTTGGGGGGGSSLIANFLPGTANVIAGDWRIAGSAEHEYNNFTRGCGGTVANDGQDGLVILELPFNIDAGPNQVICPGDQVRLQGSFSPQTITYKGIYVGFNGASSSLIYNNNTDVNIQVDVPVGAIISNTKITITYKGNFPSFTRDTYVQINHLYSTYSVPRFSEFWLHGSSTPTPLSIDLIDFYTDCHSNTITWTMNHEENILKYIIEKSNNGMNWDEYKYVVQSSNGTNGHTYSLPTNVSAKYYRMTIVFLNGETTTLDPTIAACETSIEQIKAFPNLSNGNFHVEIDVEDNVEGKLIITDLTSKVCNSENIQFQKGQNLFSFSLQLQAGTYLIHFISDKQIPPAKFNIN